MADAKIPAVPPLPPKGEMISSTSLYLQQISLYRNTLAFGGTRNPTSIWAAMTYNQPETMAYYRELEDKDEDVANCLDTLKLSVLERDRSVLPAPRDESSQAQDVKEFVEEQLGRLDFHAVLDCILDAPGYGFSVQEMIFDSSEGQAELLDINDCPQELFLFGDRFYPQVGNLQLLDNPWASTGTQMPEQKFLIFSYRKRSRNRMGRPLLKAVFWPSWFKRNIQRLWMQYAEKGPGTAVVHYNDADNASERQMAVDIAQALVDNVAVAVPKGFEFEAELLKIARALDPKVHENYFKAMQYSIARRVMGETLTSFGNEGGGGSKAQGETHADTLDKRSVELCRSLQSVINDQLIKPLVLWNFGPKAPMPIWQFDLEEAEDLELALTVDSGLMRMGKKFTVGYVSDRYDRPLTPGETEDQELVPNAAAPSVALTDRSSATFAENPARQADWSASRRRSRALAAKPSGNLLAWAEASTPRLMSAKQNVIQFAERQAEAQLHEEMAQYDKLFAQLQGEAKGIFAQRVREIAATAVPPKAGL
jgi:phage gp29-like protein